MATTFTTVQKNLSTTNTTVYTAGASNTVIAFSGTYANTHATDTVYVSLRLTVGATTTNIIGTNTPLVAGSALEIPKITMPANAYITAVIGTSDVNKVDITLSLMVM